MLGALLLTIWLSSVKSQVEVVNDALHHSMGPKFALTYEEIEQDPCTFFKETMGVDTSIECEVVAEEQDQYGRMIKLTQSIRGIPIECADIRVNLNIRGHTSINGEYFLNPPQLNELILQTEAALDRSKEVFHDGEHQVLGIEQNSEKIKFDGTILVIVCPRQIHTGRLRLGYRTRVKHSQNGKTGQIYIDAETGEHLKTHTKTYDVTGTTQTGYYGSKSVEVYWDLMNQLYYAEQYTPRNIIAADCTLASNGNCPFVSSSNKDQFGTNGQDKLMAAYWGAEKVYDLFQDQFSRSGWDGRSSKMYVLGISNVNAYWVQDNGEGYAYFGFRNNINLSSLEVVAHQMTHGIIESTANLVYQDEPGAVNEAIADIFGVYCLQKILNRPSSWDVGTETSYLTRSFTSPKDHSQPDTYKGTHWYSGTDDNGGVHTNSGPLNHAFYLMSVGGSGRNDNGTDFSVSGFGIDKAMKITYRALSRYLTQNSQYADSRSALGQAASDLYGSNSTEWYNTLSAMWAIGVGDQPTYLPAGSIVTPGSQNTGGSASASWIVPLSSSLLIGLMTVAFL